MLLRGLWRMLIKKVRFMARRIKNGYKWAIFKKKAFYGAKNLKMVSANKETCFSSYKKYLQCVYHHHNEK